MRTMIRVSLLANGFFFVVTAHGQDSLVVKKDTTKLLSEVVVHAYANDRRLLEVPAAIGYVDTKSLERFNNTSLLPAVNTIPGVRMEERSPGSYRFAIRGSSLRSPFGVRNVKMYWNGLPLTDGGGNTYINLVDFNSVATAEIIKGPGASLYGAGTGGVVLLGSRLSNQNRFQVSALGGSYGLQRYQISAQTGSEKVRASINYAHQVATGYREQTSMRRDAFNTDLRFALTSKSTLSGSIFYTDLYYQTPGGLTQAQYDANPRQARPRAGAFPGAVEQQTAVYNKTFYAGAMYDYQWDNRWSTRVGAYGSVTDFTNPTINNYEKRKENNWGGRTETQYEFEKSTWKGKLTLGGEFQHFYSPLADYANLQGTQGIIQTDDRLYSTFFLLFAQAEIDLPKDFYLTLGGSGNFLKYKFNRVSVTPSLAQERNFDPVLSPRIALLKKINDRFSVYGSISKGFSPPSLAEVRPSTGNYNNSLNPEKGISYEIGFRGNGWDQFSWDLAAYNFELDETIVVQQVNNADYFINAGRTSQKGLEALLSWSPVLQQHQFLNSLKLWSSYTYNYYRFKGYAKNSQDYSGNKLTGVPPNIVVGGVDAQVAKKFYANVTLNFVDKIPLNDANSQYSGAYILAGTRMGFRSALPLPAGRQRGKLFMDLFAGVDNATNKRYSLGNDLNAAGNRYYNAAAGRNFYVGLKISF
jgi:iron complex outermembrane receptor protein